MAWLGLGAGKMQRRKKTWDHGKVGLMLAEDKMKAEC